MNGENGFQEPIEGLFVKVLVDLLRLVTPSIDRRWVHLAVLVASAAVATGLHRESIQEFLSAWMVISLAAIGANEATRRMRTENKEQVDG